MAFWAAVGESGQREQYGNMLFLISSYRCSETVQPLSLDTLTKTKHENLSLSAGPEAS